MEKEITIQFVTDEDGYFIGKAVGYPGVIAFGKTQQAMIEGIKEAWFAMDDFNTMRNIGKSSRPAYNGKITETNLRLQLA